MTSDMPQLVAVVSSGICDRHRNATAPVLRSISCEVWCREIGQPLCKAYGLVDMCTSFWTLWVMMDLVTRRCYLRQWTVEQSLCIVALASPKQLIPTV
jgi:hypothetical protein